MAFLAAQRPLAAALARLSVRQTPRIAPAATVLSGVRYASVKAQGAYRKKSKRGIPKKLGAKRVGDQLVLPGSIIYKQRGMHWWPGENTIVGRDHSIHAVATGYVKYYKDASVHPDRQYIGVVYDKSDKLPYPKNAERRRRLNKTVHTIRPVVPKPELSPSGIPFEVRRVEEGQPDRVLKLRDDYGYREDNWAVGRIVPTTDLKVKRFRTRKQWFRARRWRREKELAGHRAGAEKRAEMERLGIKKPVKVKLSGKAAKKAEKAKAKKGKKAQK